MSSILVTGAAGFAGSHLVERLAGRHAVAAWKRPGGSPAPDVHPASWHDVDLLDKAQVVRALAEIRPVAVYHVAGAARVDTAWNGVAAHLRANVMGTHHVLEGIRLNRLACRVLVVTSALVYDTTRQPIDESAPLRPVTPYGRSKLAQDQLAIAAARDGLDVVVVRPFNHFGPRQQPGFSVTDFARQIALIEAGRLEPVMRVGNLDARRDLLDVRDTIDAYERVLLGGVTGRAYNVCSSRSVRIGDVLEQLLTFARLPIQVVVDPALLRQADAPIIVGAAQPLRDELGWAPRVPLETSLRDTLDWWRGQVQSNVR